MKRSIMGNMPVHNPLYIQLMEKLKADIETGVYPVHSRIPSEQDLCDAYHVSRVTVRKALRELVLDGILDTRQGCGTFVATEKSRHDFNRVGSFTSQYIEQGFVPSTRLVHAGIKNASPQDIRDLVVIDKPPVIVEI